MPALGSSVINKSGRKFAPKAPLRRPAPTTPPQSSAAANLPTLEITQPQTVEPLARPSAPFPPASPHASTGVQVAHVVAQRNNDRPAHEELRDQDATAEDRGTQLDVHKRKLDATLHDGPEEIQCTANASSIPLSESSTAVPQSPQSTIPITEHSQPPASIPRAEARNGSFPAGPPQPVAPGPTLNTASEITKDNGPPAKRRKVTPSQSKVTSRQRPGARDQTPTRSSSIQVVINPNSVPADSPRKSAGKGHAVPAKATRNSTVKKRGTREKGPAIAEVVIDDARSSSRPITNAQTKAKVRKPRRAAKAGNQLQLHEAAAEIVADAAERTTSRRKGRRGRNERELTPEEAENETIEPGRIKMADLCKDTRKGKKSDMLRALQERDREEMTKKARKDLQQLLSNEAPIEPGGAANPAAEGCNATASTEKEVERRQEVARQVAGTYVNDHGEIMIDTESLQVDRHALAAVERQQGQLETVEENYLSKPAVNSWTHAIREKPSSWSEELTDEFYDALRMFGTDFDMIGRMLRKTRRAIKLKFTREERLDPDRINQTLLGERMAVDVEDFSRRAGEELKETEELELLMEEDRKQIEETAAEELRAKEGQEQLRKDQAEQEGAAVADDSSGKENRENGKKKGRGKKKKKKKKKGKEDGEKTKGCKRKEKVVEPVS
ncbi:MAG: hypothetical protein Q9182_001677 [Xanthomendoza sp. 2 TL-2023]